MKFDEIKNVIVFKIPLEKLDQKVVIEFLDEMRTIFENEPQLIKLPKKEAVFAGDTHSDYEASMKVITRYLDNRISVR